MDGGQEDLSIRDWLGSAEGLDLLGRVARSLCAEAASRALSAALFGRNPAQKPSGEEMWAEIRAELSVFVLEREPLLGRILRLPSGVRHRVLKQAFIHHWISRTRTPEKDRRRYLYKRIADLIREDGRFYTRTHPRRGTTYTMDPEAVSVPPLLREDLSAIPFSKGQGGSGTYETLNKKEVLLTLAGHFWEVACGLWGGKAVWLAVRDLVAWIGLYVSLESGLEISLETERGDAACGGVGPPTADGTAFDAQSVKAWARKFSGRLEAREREVFHLFYGAGLNLEQVAEKLGYAGPSGPKYRLDQAVQKLKSFLRDLPWLAPDDLNEEAFSLFFETLLADLKNERLSP